MPVSHHFEAADPNWGRAEEAFKTAQDVQIDVHVQDVPAFDVDVSTKHVHDGLKANRYLPLNPEGDHPTEPADLKGAVETFSTGDTSMNIRLRRPEAPNDTPLAMDIIKKPRVRRAAMAVGGVLLAAAVLGTSNNSSPGSNYNAAGDKAAHDAAVSQAHTETARKLGAEQIDKRVIKINNENNQ